MEQWIDSLLEWIRLHPHWASVTVLVVSALESFLVVGLFVPGTVVMFAIGAMVAAGGMELVPTLVWAIVGAILGDGSSYLIGRHFHQRLRVIWPFRTHPDMMAQGMDFFHRHGGKSIVLARFVGPVRPLVPAIAGMLDMPINRFFVINVLSAILWAPAYMLPGILFGASLGVAAEIAGRLALLLGLLVALLWFSWWLVRRIARSLQPHAEAVQIRILEWSRRYRFIEPLAGALLDPEHPEARGMTVLTALLVVASWMFLMTVQQLTPGSLLNNIDLYVYHTLQGLRSPLADRLLVRVTELGDALVLYGFTAVVSLWLLWHRYWRAVVHWVTTVAGVGLLTQATKLATGVERPETLYSLHAGYSFPSSHASLSVAVFGFLAVLIARELRRNWHWVPYSLAVFLVTAIAFSRLYLGAHWLSDILGGVSLGLVWVAMLGIGYRVHPAPRIPPTRLITVVLVSLLAIGTFYGKQRFETDLARYQPRLQQHTISRAEWLAGGWQRLPTWRNDLEGRHHHPMNVQWAGTLERLRQVLEEHGWRRPGAVYTGLPDLFTADAGADRLPVLPQLHDGREQQLLLVRPGGDPQQLQVVRLWPSGHVLDADSRTLWVGNTSFLREDHAMKLFTLLVTARDFDTPLQVLREHTAGLGQKLVQRPAEQVMEGRVEWHGEVLLLYEPP